MANLPEPSRKRLLSLLLLLRQQEEAFSDKTGGSPAITSRTIARLTGWTDATIRRDISQLGLRCGAAKGYPIGELGEAIEEALDRYCKHSRLTYKGMLVERHMATTPTSWIRRRPSTPGTLPNSCWSQSKNSLATKRFLESSAGGSA